MSKLGIAELKGRNVNQLSGGQKQRVAIARAIIKNPLLIIADEPTGALDRNTANEITDVLINAVKESGATLIVATHDTVITERFDKVVRLENGNLSG
ncbi:MAG TPA: ATP-binding cassette domain-containing protein [Candidatus Ornithoclostridium faecavium]|nr:ATP-binding cassette domain-containing protein [Candidatus Ornithoclostridium faecavium]